MKAKLITFILGALAGGLGVFFAGQGNQPPVVDSKPNERSQPPRINLDSDAKKIARLEEKIAELEATGSTADDNEAKPPKIVKMFGNNKDSQIDLTDIKDLMEKSNQARSEKLIKSRLATLTSKLNLTDEQIERVRELLEKDVATQSGGLAVFLDSALAGGVQREDEAADDFDFDAELDALLDEDQKAAYAAHIEAQNENYIEASANRQLAQLQTNVSDLSKEQKDRAFNEFARIARDEVESSGIPAAGGMNIDIARMTQQRDARQEAMNEILSPEQAEVYKTNSQNVIGFENAPGSVITSSIVIDSTEIPIPQNDDE